MRIRVSFIGPIKPPKEGRNFEKEFKEGITIEQLLEQLGYDESMRRYFAPVVNGEKRRFSYQLKNGDQLDIFLPIGGG